MSTSYEIHGGTGPSRDDLINDHDNITVELVTDPPPSWVAHQDEENYVHLYFDDDGFLVAFERFGANDPAWFIEEIESIGLFVRSEHDQVDEDEFHSLNR